MQLPDYILPAQLGDRPLGGARIQPEKRLQVAVLTDAVATFRRLDGIENPQLVAEIEARSRLIEN